MPYFLTPDTTELPIDFTGSCSEDTFNLVTLDCYDDPDNTCTTCLLNAKGCVGRNTLDHILTVFPDLQHTHPEYFL